MVCRLGTALVALLLLAAAKPPSVSAQVRPLPNPPLPTNANAALLFDARLAIERANAQAAQRAQFAYRDAINRYANGDIAGARSAATQALISAAQGAPVARPADVAPLVPAPPPPLTTTGGALAVDADEFFVRARDALGNCAVHHPERLTLARRQFDAVARARAAGDVVRERIAARDLIARCGLTF